MRGLIADLRYGLAEALGAPRSTTRSAAWLLAGVTLGLGLARWVDAPLATHRPGPAAAAAVDAKPVPASRPLDRESESRLRCRLGDGACPTPTPPSPCAVPSPGRIDS